VYIVLRVADGSRHRIENKCNVFHIAIPVYSYFVAKCGKKRAKKEQKEGKSGPNAQKEAKRRPILLSFFLYPENKVSFFSTCKISCILRYGPKCGASVVKEFPKWVV